MLVILCGSSGTRLKVRADRVAHRPASSRPTEVDILLGNATKAQQKLDWTPENTAHQMCKGMVVSDLQEANRYALLGLMDTGCR